LLRLISGHFAGKGKSMMITITRWFTVFGLLLLLATHGLAAELEKFKLLKIDATEQKAVFKTSEGKLELVGGGDRIGDAKIVAIEQNAVVLERPGEFGTETVIVRLLENGGQKIDRMEKQPLRSTLLPGR
jgi:hypothetical protein